MNRIYCTVGDGLVVVLEGGGALHCRGLPLLAGNLNNSSMKDIYFNSPVMKELQSYSGIAKGCENCNLFNLCRGGAKCISYGIYGDYKRKDHGCSIKTDSIKGTSI